MPTPDTSSAARQREHLLMPLRWHAALMRAEQRDASNGAVAGDSAVVRGPKKHREQIQPISHLHKTEAAATRLLKTRGRPSQLPHKCSPSPTLPFPHGKMPGSAPEPCPPAGIPLPYPPATHVDIPSDTVRYGTTEIILCCTSTAEVKRCPQNSGTPAASTPSTSPIYMFAGVFAGGGWSVEARGGGREGRRTEGGKG